MQHLWPGAPPTPWQSKRSPDIAKCPLVEVEVEAGVRGGLSPGWEPPSLPPRSSLVSLPDRNFSGVFTGIQFVFLLAALFTACLHTVPGFLLGLPSSSDCGRGQSSCILDIGPRLLWACRALSPLSVVASQVRTHRHRAHNASVLEPGHKPRPLSPEPRLSTTGLQRYPCLPNRPLQEGRQDQAVRLREGREAARWRSRSTTWMTLM